MTTQAETVILSPGKSLSCQPLLRIENLSARFSLQGQWVHAVRDISFEVHAGEVVGIVGESGCGKSTLVQAIVGLSRAAQVNGHAYFEGIDLIQHPSSVLGIKIGMVFQDPMTSLNPTLSIGHQIGEGLLFHRLLKTRKEARAKSLELLKCVGMPEPALRLSQYPHQLSGGMRQRVLIAIAIACNPKLLIADEPTTALDVTVQAQILALLQQLQRELRMGMIYISHDLRLVASLCQKILVLYAGKVVEQGTVRKVLHHPRHPYTQMLLDALPRLGQREKGPLKTIEGTPPNGIDIPQGCSFAKRCPYAKEKCWAVSPPFFEGAACWREES